MKVLVSGSSGLVGSALCASLSADGHDVVRLVRRPDLDAPSVHWDIDAGQLDASALEGLDAVVHLAGESIAGRWTAKKKAEIHQSRVKGTRLLAKTLAKLESPPGVLICASAIGAYGSRGDEELDESSTRGDDWLSQLAAEWEASCEDARRANIRVVNLRIGLVLAAKGGALGKMLTPFRLGVGGRVGSGKQWMSWVSIKDLVSAIRFAIDNDSLEGPVNCTAPNPATNTEFTKALGRVLKRPTVFPLPAFAVRALFGEMGESLLLGSQRVMPRSLQTAGFEFAYPDLEGCLRDLLGKAKA